MNEYLSGRKLYGDDFSFEQIKQWYEEEAEAYANLGNKDIDSYTYGYHQLNILHGYRKIGNQPFENVLGFGSAWGEEFKPILSNIKHLTILEPSDNMVSAKIAHLTPKYVKPTVDGSINFEDNSFDLITCFGVLHHIPNVTFVLSELMRVLKPNGYLLLREPIISMGDWRTERPGLTKNERGIPPWIFEGVFHQYSAEIIAKNYCFTMTAFITRKIGRFLKKPLFSSKIYTWIDKYISKLFSGNIHYHATTKFQRIAPSAVFYVVKKIADKQQ